MSAKDTTSNIIDSSTFEVPAPLLFDKSEVEKNHIDKAELYTSIIERTESFGKSKIYYGAVGQETKNDWILGFLLVALMTIAIVKAFQPKRVNMLISTLTNWKIGKQIIRYEKVHSHPVNIGLSFVFISASSLFLALCAVEFYSFEIGLTQIWLSIMLGIGVYSILKIIIYKLSAFLLIEDYVFKEYTFHTLLFAKLLGVVCLFGVALFEYSYLPKTNTAILVGSISAILFLFQLIRGVQIGQQKTQNLLSIILYLCTLEILPLIVLSKWVLGELSRA